ncbi:acyl-CoA thioesterase [Oceanicella actignis]|uniref:Acyl-CoA thioester hydrolase n=1 Tax=Oceanicella actignis TaxID=1189325 RepID=A0A1M7SPX6_9RHOB|nr:thioesterase family protein [Oceanicella actignis]TYO90826.1 acyl-CoA thioester hydrolase [Oceanicella actignis]SES66500.1 acyl-CoA thioester hydrolase [Oceanicella actignis]SHN60587.1 acyl-CoA thioester hydrolase [Oceanicella actignis]
MPAPRPRRDQFPHLRPMTTRWRDNDVYGHMNNVVYYEYFDTAVNHWMIERGALEIPHGPFIALVAETRCAFMASLGFPDMVTAGLRAARIGRSSVTYDIALFRNDEDEACAAGAFVHVVVDAASRRPSPLPDTLRAALDELVTPQTVLAV